MDDWDVFFDPADFADVAHWETQSGDFVDVHGIFTAASLVVLDGVSSSTPTFTLAEKDVPASAAQADQVEIRDVNYLVSDMQPDGSGMVRVILEKD